MEAIITKAPIKINKYMKNSNFQTVIIRIINPIIIMRLAINLRKKKVVYLIKFQVKVATIINIITLTLTTRINSIKIIRLITIT
jgi:hypothetical protein